MPAFMLLHSVDTFHASFSNCMQFIIYTMQSPASEPLYSCLQGDLLQSFLHKYPKLTYIQGCSESKYCLIIKKYRQYVLKQFYFYKKVNTVN